MRAKLLALAAMLTVVAGSGAIAVEKRHTPRPAVWVDNDMVSIPEPTQAHEDSLFYDFLHSSFGHAPQMVVTRPSRRQPAWNVNAWDEVPDSSWFTNRNHLHPMTPEEIRRGANRGPAPDLSGPLVVLKGKDVGTGLGLGRVRDSRGNIYFIKFDSVDNPELATSAEVVASRLFYALGFSVPEEWIISFRPDQVQVDPKAELWDKTGRKRKMTQADVEENLKGAYRLPDGRVRAFASLLLPGKYHGRFKFHGTRKDDPNDLIPHEHRRELRGLRLFSAWLNAYDIRAGNTMAMYVDEGGRKFLRHYLQDVGSTLGSASYFPKVVRMGNSYIFDWQQMAGPFFTLGLYQPSWREHPEPIKYPSVGRFESARFSPPAWRPVFPIVAFAYLEDADAFWAARVVMSFTDEQIGAAVDAGEYIDPTAAQCIKQTLIARRNKIGGYGLLRTSPLSGFKIDAVPGASSVLRFENVAEHYGFSTPGKSRYTYQLHVPRQNRWQPVGSEHSVDQPAIPLAELTPEAQRVLASDTPGRGPLVLFVRVANPVVPLAGRPVHVYLEHARGSDQFRLLGFDREE